MKKTSTLLCAIALALPLDLFAQEAETAPVEAVAPVENPGTPVNPPRDVSAKWTNGNFYNGKVIAEREGQGLVKWDDGSEPIWVDNADIKQLKKAAANARKVYAEYHNGMYYKALVIETTGGDTLIQWEDGSGTATVPNAKVHPRVGHKLKKDMIADRELSPAEQKAADKANAQAKKDNAAKYSASCSRLRTRLDCMRTFDPCVWNNNHCEYRGY